MTLAQYKAVEDDQDHAEMCAEQRLRAALRCERPEQKIGRRMLIAFGLGIALLAALSVAGKGDMEAAAMSAQNNDAKPYEGVMDR